MVTLSEVKELPLVYTRHLMHSNLKGYKELISEHLIALHYEGENFRHKNTDRCSTNPEDYKDSAKNALERLRNYCKSGALVVADYNRASRSRSYVYDTRWPSPQFLIGILPSNSEIECKIIGPCQDDKDGEVNQDNYPNGAAYKVVKLEHVVQIEYSDLHARPLIALQPRLGGVIVNWKVGNIGNYVKALYLKKRRLGVEEEPLKFLADYQLEVLCSEYLRRYLLDENKIDYLLLPVGRTMKDIDIEGASKTTRVLAQVSYTSNKKEIERKIRQLRLYEKRYDGKKLVLIYFGPRQHKEMIRKYGENIMYIPIEDVKETMREVGILEDMLF